MRTVRKTIKYIFICIVIIGIGACSYLTYEGYTMYKDAVNEVSIEDKVAEIRSQRQYTQVEELPRIYKEAIISVEDHRKGSSS